MIDLCPVKQQPVWTGLFSGHRGYGHCQLPGGSTNTRIFVTISRLRSNLSIYCWGNARGLKESCSVRYLFPYFCPFLSSWDVLSRRRSWEAATILNWSFWILYRGCSDDDKITPSTWVSGARIETFSCSFPMFRTFRLNFVWFAFFYQVTSSASHRV